MFLETRPSFLLLSVVVVSLGTAVAWHDGFFNPLFFALTLAGVLLAHVSVNVLNDYFDYRSGLDLEIAKAGKRTPFSGGSGLLPSRAISPGRTLRMGVLSLVLAAPIGVYFLRLRGLMLLPLVLTAAVTVVLYTPAFSRVYLGEFLAGLNFGPLAVLGTYAVQTGSYGAGALVASLVPGILTGELLLLNEFPDVEADERAGRRHLVILLGRGTAGALYSVLLAATYLLIVLGTLFRLLPPTAPVSLLTGPFAFKASRIAVRDPDSLQAMLPALKHNVIAALGTPALLAVGYLLKAAY